MGAILDKVIEALTTRIDARGKELIRKATEPYTVDEVYELLIEPKHRDMIRQTATLCGVNMYGDWVPGPGITSTEYGDTLATNTSIVMHGPFIVPDYVSAGRDMTGRLPDWVDPDSPIARKHKANCETLLRICVACGLAKHILIYMNNHYKAPQIAWFYPDFKALLAELDMFKGKALPKWVENAKAPNNFIAATQQFREDKALVSEVFAMWHMLGCNKGERSWPSDAIMVDSRSILGYLRRHYTGSYAANVNIPCL